MVGVRADPADVQSGAELRLQPSHRPDQVVQAAFNRRQFVLQGHNVPSLLRCGGRSHAPESVARHSRRWEGVCTRLPTRTGAFRQPCARRSRRRYGRAARGCRTAVQPRRARPGGPVLGRAGGLGASPTCRAAGPGAVAFSRGAIDVMSRKVGRTWCAGQAQAVLGAARASPEVTVMTDHDHRAGRRACAATPLRRAHRGGGAAPAAGPDRMQRRRPGDGVRRGVPGHRPGTPRRS